MTSAKVVGNLLMAALLALPEPWPYLTTCLLYLAHQMKRGPATASPP